MHKVILIGFITGESNQSTSVPGLKDITKIEDQSFLKMLNLFLTMEILTIHIQDQLMDPVLLPRLGNNKIGFLFLILFRSY